MIRTCRQISIISIACSSTTVHATRLLSVAAPAPLITTTCPTSRMRIAGCSLSRPRAGVDHRPHTLPARLSWSGRLSHPRMSGRQMHCMARTEHSGDEPAAGAASSSGASPVTAHNDRGTGSNRPPGNTPLEHARSARSEQQQQQQQQQLGLGNTNNNAVPPGMVDQEKSTTGIGSISGAAVGALLGASYGPLAGPVGAAVGASVGAAVGGAVGGGPIGTKPVKSKAEVTILREHKNVMKSATVIAPVGACVGTWAGAAWLGSGAAGAVVGAALGAFVGEVLAATGHTPPVDVDLWAEASSDEGTDNEGK